MTASMKAQFSITPLTYSTGIQTFAKLFTRWMDTNDWSHPVMTQLARGVLGGTSWLHSSQISGLRHGSLISPGPRTFIAIAELNRCLYVYLNEKRLIPGTVSSNFYVNGYCITEDGEPPSAGWWFEVFCGLRKPKDIKLDVLSFTTDQAWALSKATARLIRKLAFIKSYDIYEDLDRMLREHYPARDLDRVQLIIKVIRDETVWSPDQLVNEIPALAKLVAALGGPETEEQFMDNIL